jgi:GrpB-like predicted nucleotidyltransferase (UPF0157 family)
VSEAAGYRLRIREREWHEHRVLNAQQRLEHVGSTAVAGFVAKPRIDMLLVVADPATRPRMSRCL